MTELCEPTPGAFRAEAWRHWVVHSIDLTTSGNGHPGVAVTDARRHVCTPGEHSAQALRASLRSSAHSCTALGRRVVPPRAPVGAAPPHVRSAVNALAKPALGDRAQEETKFVRAALLHGYGLQAKQVLRVQAGTDTLNYWVVLDVERQVFVKAMRVGTDERDVRTTAHLATFARSGGLPVPRMWLSRDGVPLIRYEDRILTVQEYIDGNPASGRALTVARAEELGGVVGRLHRRLALYRGTLPTLPARLWTAEGMSRFDADYQRLQLTLTQHGGERAATHRELLEQPREDLLTHAAALRRGFPAAPVRQPLHADLTTPNVLMNSTNRVAAVIDFYARTGPAAWEVGRIALDPRTVAGETNWMPVTLALIAAYHQENPYLPCAELVASVRMALVHALHSLFGLHEHYVIPEAYEVGDVLRYWEQRHVMTRRVLERLDSVEEQIRTAVGAQ